MSKVHLILGDCLDKLKELEDNSVDSIVTDPPYGLSAAPNSGKKSKGGFMGKQWDYDVPSIDIWNECYRVLKPGGHLLSFAGSRTYHRMAVRIEDAGFEIRDQLMWIYGSGFPKSMDISKQIDKREGVEREVVGIKQNTYDGSIRNNENHIPPAELSNIGKWGLNKTPHNQPLTTPSTELAKQWSGWGTALKPAHEPIVMARKPLSEKTVVDNVVKWGTGGINIDESRISTNETITNHSRSAESAISKGKYGDSSEQQTHQTEGQKLGRFPANVIFDEEAGKLLDEQSGIRSSGFMKAGTPRLMSDNPNKNTYGTWKPDTVLNDTYGDTGGASRFFYCPKVSKRERNEGLDGFANKNGVKQFTDKGGLKCKKCNKWKNSGNPCQCNEPDFEQQQWNGTIDKNSHPTVKPIDLLLYLIRLVTPPNGTTLDPFMGSGSSGRAAVREGFGFIGIEREDEYFQIAEVRIEYERLNPIKEKKNTDMVNKEIETTLNKFFE